MRQLVITKQITNRSEESINRYFQEINKFSLISAEEEVELAVRIKQGDDAALEKLVLANLRFVVSVAKQYQNQGLSFSDLINEGNMGLVKAATKFDETRGFKFISYAVWWVRQSIIQAISDQTRIVHLPLNRVSSINKVAKAISNLEQKFSREPTDDEIGTYLELDTNDVKIVNSIKKRSVSLDSPISQNSESDYSLYDTIQSESIPSPDHKIMTESASINIQRALNKLSKREEKILIMSFGLFNSQAYTLHDISETMNMTTERVRQIKNKALLKLKFFLRNKFFFLE
jgi:RNA polymerase primary sigma factor